MHKFPKRMLSVLMAVLLTISTFSASMTAYAAGSSSEESAVSTGSMTVESYTVADGAQGEIVGEAEDFIEGSPESPEMSEDKSVSNLNLTNGVTDCELGTVEDKVADPVLKLSSAKEIQAPAFDKTTETSIEIEDETPPDIEATLGFSSISASSKNVNVYVGSESTVTISYFSVFYSNVKIVAKLNNSNISGKFGKANNRKIPLTFHGNQEGTTEVTLTLYNSSGKELDSVKIKVTVQKRTYVSVSSSRVDLPAGKTSYVSVTFSGGSRCVVGTSGVGCTYWVSGNKLYFTGTNVGTTRFRVYLLNGNNQVLDHKDVTVNVSRNATITSSAKNVSVDIGASATVSLKANNAYGTLKYKFALSNGNCVAAWTSSGSNCTLKLSGKKAGTTAVTVTLYDGNSNFLASYVINVNTVQNPKVIANCSSISILPAAKSKITFGFTGYSGAVKLAFSNPNGNVCKVSWASSWVGNTVCLNVLGYHKGTSNITVSMYDGSGRYLASKTVSVNVAGEPGINVSAASLSVNMGSQKALSVSVTNVASGYKLTYAASGTCYTASWTTVGSRSYNCNIKGISEGKGSITLRLKTEDGTVLATKTVSLNILWVENPQISTSKTTLSFTEKSSDTVNISCTGTKKSFYIQAACIKRNGDNALSMSFTGSSKGSATLKIGCSSICNATVAVRMIETSTGKILASKNLTVRSMADTSARYGITYSFENESSNIPKDTFYAVFGKNLKANECWKKFHNAGGVCHGMASGAMMMKYGSVSPSAFGASSIRSLTKKSYSSLYSMNMKRYIDMMYISQFATYYLSHLSCGINGLCNTVANGNVVQVKISGPYGKGRSAHAVIAYKLDKVNNLLYIADSNWPNSARAITLKGSYGNYTGWEYELFSGTTWNDSKAPEPIKYQYFSAINTLFRNFGDLTATPESYSANTNMMFTSAESFKILDVEQNVVATFSNGKLTTSNDGIMYVLPENVNIDADPNEVTSETLNTFVLPTDFYIVENCGKSENFEVEMVNNELGVKVVTEGNQVTFGVDDNCDLCATSLSLDVNDDYDVTLLSSREGEGEIHVSGQAVTNNVELGFEMVEGKLAESSSYGASICVDDEPQNYTEITASSNEGGTISPEGTSTAVIGSDVSYTITPDEGYFVADVIVNGESIGPALDYTFVNVEESSTIQAVFAEDIAPEGKATSVTVSDVSVDYKGTAKLNALIAADDNASYSVRYSSKNPDIATVDSSGNVYGVKKGKTTVYCTVTDSLGNTVQDTCTVNVSYTPMQWFIKIVLFGWLWY